MRFKGVTLIELVVTIAIIAVLMAAAVPLVNRSNRANGIKNEAERLSTFIQRAKNYAQNPEDANAISYKVLASGQVGNFNIVRCTESNCNYVVEQLQMVKIDSIGGWQDLQYNCFDGKFIGAQAIVLKIKRPDTTVELGVNEGQPNIISSS